MFGAFKPSAPLSGGLLWKIPWRLSPTRKLRHRRRLRRVDNVVSVLDSALKRSALSTTSISHQPLKTPPNAANKASKEDLSTTAEGQRLLSDPSSILTRRHGRGPLLGEYLPTSTTIPAHNSTGSITLPSHDRSTLLRDSAKENQSIKMIERWKHEMPTEGEMLPKDKYTIFDRKVRGYRKGVHKVPKWTRVSQRVNPPGF